jgi:hypothetical protein
MRRKYEENTMRIRTHLPTPWLADALCLAFASHVPALRNLLKCPYLPFYDARGNMVVQA